MPLVGRDEDDVTRPDGDGGLGAGLGGSLTPGAIQGLAPARRSPAIRANIGVSTMPGRMTLTRIGASWRAIALASTSEPPAAADTMAPPARGRPTPAPVQIVIEPDVIFGAAYLQRYSGPQNRLSTGPRSVAVSTSAIAPATCVPARLAT